MECSIYKIFRKSLFSFLFGIRPTTSFFVIFFSVGICNAAVLPDPTAFRDGDLIWPKKEGAYVPFNSKPTSTSKVDSDEWERERQQFIERVQNDSGASQSQKELAARVAKMNFEEFREEVLGQDMGGREVVPYGSGGYSIYTGHVGMIFFENSEPWVVEAVPPKVQKIPYKKWLKEREGADVWHARVIGLKPKDQEKMIEQALEHVGKPYSLWDLNLNDPESFYCSKLIWFVIYRSLGWSLDDNPESDRLNWYTPKQIMQSPHVEMFFAPTTYGNRD